LGRRIKNEEKWGYKSEYSIIVRGEIKNGSKEK